jgi:hypothetical protein
MRLAGPLPTAPTLGTAVFGEDDESDEALMDDDCILGAYKYI